MAQYTLSEENVRTIPDGWFQACIDRMYDEDKTLQDILSLEVKVLQLFHNGSISADEAACAITRPITDYSVPKLNTYSDDSRALAQLWALLIEALIEWPSTQTPPLVALLIQIKKAPGHIHRGEARDEEEKPLCWDDLPYFTRVWSDNHWMSPGQIARRCPDDATLRRARDQYIKQQDVEAQIVAAQLFTQGPLAYPRALQYVVQALEWTPGSDDHRRAPDDALADEQIRLDFLIPASGRWITHCGQRLYNSLHSNDIPGWDPRDIPRSPVSFGNPHERWTFWVERLLKLLKEEQDDELKEAAESAVRYMRTIANGQNL
ncbi:hypothetical protein JX266_007145 [Neoarthrinium moseri]|nr:hypothetical protein JX266_007145 [Neoarthrinium moseri]